MYMCGWLFKQDFLQLEVALTSFSHLLTLAGPPPAVHPTGTCGKGIFIPPTSTLTHSCLYPNKISKQPHLSLHGFRLYPRSLKILLSMLSLNYPLLLFPFSLKPPKRRLHAGVSISFYHLSHLSLPCSDPS